MYTLNGAFMIVIKMQILILNRNKKNCMKIETVTNRYRHSSRLIDKK